MTSVKFFTFFGSYKRLNYCFNAFMIISLLDKSRWDSQCNEITLELIINSQNILKRVMGGVLDDISPSDSSEIMP